MCDVSVVVLSWNTQALTRKCLQALRANGSRRAMEVIVVDNGSSDGSVAMITAEFPEVKLIPNRDNKLYAEGNNQGARAGNGKWLCLLNSDTEVYPNALDLLIDFLEANPDYGAAAPQLLNPDGSIQEACRAIPSFNSAFFEATVVGKTAPAQWLYGRTGAYRFDHTVTSDVEQPPGACFLMLREEYLAGGGLDPRLSLYFNDVDICRRLLEGGRKIRYLSEAKVMHHGGASTTLVPSARNTALWFRNMRAYYKKHHGAAGDAWMAFILCVWASEVGVGISVSRRSISNKRDALRSLAQQVQEAFAP